MSAEICRFTGVTKLDASPDLILKEAIEKLEGCVIVGYDKNGEEFFASSYADAGDVIFHLERAKWRLMTRLDEMADGK